MFQGATEHYNMYYRYDLPKGVDPGEKVNSLFERVIRNDMQAMEEVLRILGSNTYFMVCRHLDWAGNGTRENVDAVMQSVRQEIIISSFRCFQTKNKEVTQDKFFGYLIGVTEVLVKNFNSTLMPTMKKKDGERIPRLIYNADNKSVDDDTSYVNEDANNPEYEYLKEERRQFAVLVLKKYMEVLQESTLMPHQLLVYCYSVLIPQLFKKTKNSNLLEWVEPLSSRKKLPPNSSYNKEKNCLEGELAKNSIELLNWAVEAMHKKKIAELDQEFLTLYDMEKIVDVPFQWGMAYRRKMDVRFEGSLEKEIILTEMFKIARLKNWSKRVMKRLITETVEQMKAEMGSPAMDLMEEILGTSMDKLFEHSKKHRPAVAMVAGHSQE